jgi:hypothetical protein
MTDDVHQVMAKAHIAFGQVFLKKSSPLLKERQLLPKLLKER